MPQKNGCSNEKRFVNKSQPDWNTGEVTNIYLQTVILFRDIYRNIMIFRIFIFNTNSDYISGWRSVMLLIFVFQGCAFAIYIVNNTQPCQTARNTWKTPIFGSYRGRQKADQQAAYTKTTSVGKQPRTSAQAQHTAPAKLSRTSGHVYHERVDVVHGHDNRPEDSGWPGRPSPVVAPYREASSSLSPQIPWESNVHAVFEW